VVAIHEHAQHHAPWEYRETPAMSDVQFKQWAGLLESRTGISLPGSRKTFLQTNLVTRMRELKSEGYQSYYDLVTDGTRGNVEWEILVDRLTVHETRFYRDLNSLNLIRDEYLGLLLKKNNKDPYTVHAWSVGCATGEEPYSLAMMMDEVLCDQKDLYYGITATDISRAALETGRKALYHNRRVANVPSHLADQHLEQIDKDHVQVSVELRQKVCFTQANLIDLQNLPVTKMDIILCQNVLIYFKHEIRNRILQQLAAKLKSGGILVLGAGEVFSWSHPELEQLNYDSTLAFRRNISSGSAG